MGCSPWGREESDATEASWQQQWLGLGFLCVCWLLARLSHSSVTVRLF